MDYNIYQSYQSIVAELLRLGLRYNISALILFINCLLDYFIIA
jgi:hypothetical protein